MQFEFWYFNDIKTLSPQKPWKYRVARYDISETPFLKRYKEEIEQFIWKTKSKQKKKQTNEMVRKEGIAELN